MAKPANCEICGVITSPDLKLVARAEGLVSRYEVRIDLIGTDWQKIARKLTKPWIATNRPVRQGGSSQASERKRLAELYRAVELGADVIDLELGTPELETIIDDMRCGAKCLVSYHNFNRTPRFSELAKIVKRQMDCGADLCKVVTTARDFKDNLKVLGLYQEFSSLKLISFAMGEAGVFSRVFSPLLGAPFVYAALSGGFESAPGQLDVGTLKELYGMIEK